MDGFEQNKTEKETNDSHHTFYQNVIHYNEKENAFIKKLYKCGIFSLVFVIKLEGRMTDLFSRTTEDRQGPDGLTEFITM